MFRRIHARGWWYSIGIIVNKIVPERLWRMRIFRVFEFRAPDSPQEHMPDDAITFRWCETEAELAEAARLTFYQPDESSRGHRACLALEGDEAIGGVWIGENQFDESELGLRIDLADDQVWLFAAYVAKSHRRRGIYRRLLEFVLRSEASGERPKTVYASINPTNKASIAAHRVYVADVAGTSLAVRVLSWTWCCANGRLRVDQSRMRIIK